MTIHRSIPSAAIAIICLMSAANAWGRTFTDSTGRFTVEAELVDVKNGRAHLKKKTDGTIVAVPVARLCKADQKHIRDFLERTAPEPPSKPSATRQPVLKVGRTMIERELAKTTDYEFAEVPLDQAIEQLSKKHGLQIVIAHRDLDAIGVSAAVPVTGSVKRLQLRRAIARLLEPLKLCLVIHNDLPVVTSTKEADRYTVIRVYRIIRPVANTDALVDAITQKITPKNWDHMGGAGSICSVYLRVLVVAQTEDAHSQLAKSYSKFLRPLVVPEKKPTRRPARDRSTAAQALRQTTEFEFVDTPLSRVATVLGEMHKVKIAVDDKSLQAKGLSPESTTVTMSLSNIALESALEHLLDRHGLRHVVDEDALLITTAREAAKMVTPRSYTVGDVVRMEDYDGLLEAITSTVAPITWDQVGGIGSIEVLKDRSVLQITQSQRVHQQLERLLSDLRMSLKP